MRKVLDMLNILHKAVEPTPEDRQIKALRSQLHTEAYGLRRANILLRTELMNEILERPERQKK